MNLDPNLAALLGAGAGANDQFTQMLLRAINPNASGELTKDIGAPNTMPLTNIAAAAPSIKTADPQPALEGPQMMQALGFGMAGAAGRPGASALSALGEGGKDVLAGGSAAAERAIREAAQENNANLAEWEGKSKIADQVLNAQMKEPELDMKMMELTGQSLARDASRQETAAYHAGTLADRASLRDIQEQNAKTAGARATTGQQRADTYGEKVAGDQASKDEANRIRQAALDQKATEFQSRLAATSAQSGSRLSLEATQAAAREFKNEMQLRKNPITGELPDESVQEALRQSLLDKYTKAAKPQKAAPADALKQAQAAIAAGADPAKVKARLESVGIDPSGLG